MQTALSEDERIKAEWMRRDLLKFMEGAWHVLEPATPFVSGFHIEAVAEHLQLVTSGEILKLMINMPPRHMKSLSASVFWPAWEWASKPATRWLYASYAQSLATEHSVLCRRLIESDWYQARWGSVFQLEDDQNQKTKFENNRTGLRRATSVGGTATGAGGDRIVYDDPHNANEIESDTVRQGVIEWYDGVMPSRKNDPKKSSEVVIMQRLHEDDLAGHALKQEDDWELLCLPAEYEPNRCRLTTGWEDPREKPGELLWGERIGVTELAVLKNRLGSYRYAGQYQQNPVPAEGGILKRKWWQYYDPTEAPPFSEILQSWDMTYKDTDGSDWVVGQVWGRDLANKYLIRQFRQHAAFTETVKALVAMTAWVEKTYPQHKSHVKLIEDAANGPAVITTLKRKIPGLIPVSADVSKEARAHAASPEVEAGNVYLPGGPNLDGDNYDALITPQWVQDFVEEATHFPKASHDDQVDAATQALIRMAGRAPVPLQPRTGKPKRRVNL